MKVEITEKGHLKVISETAIESFALHHWFDLWQDHKAVLSIETKDLDGDDKRTFIDPHLK